MHTRFKKVAKEATRLLYQSDFDANVDEVAKIFSRYSVPLNRNTTVIQRREV